MLLNYGAGEDSWDSSLDCKEIKPVNFKGNQPWIGRIHAEAEDPILRPPNESTHWKRPDVGKDWRQKEEGPAEDEMIR